jgi:ABC-type branched-subunit amino acid transport system substrate-binding protein
MRRFLGIVLVAATVVAYAGLGSGAGAQGSDQTQGVTKTEIRVGGVVGKTNPVGQPYASGFDGAQAYFDYINGKGGVEGRKFKVVAKLDDQSRASQNIAACRSLNEEKKVFAVIPVVTQIFACGSYLAQKGVPAFGWNINAEWCGTSTEVAAINTKEAAGDAANAGTCPRKNLFGEKGSYLCFTCPSVTPAVIAHQLGVKKVGVMAYTAPQSVECAKGEVAGFEKYGFDVAFTDEALAFGFSDLGDDIKKIKDSGVEFIATCMDLGGEVKIARALQRAGITGVKFYAPNGFDPIVPKKFGKDVNGIFFGIEFFPFDTPANSAGMKLFLKQMKKEGFAVNEQSLAGWQNAVLLTEAIKKAGPNFTRQSVIDAANSFTDWTADNIRFPVNWTSDGHGPGHEVCAGVVEAKDGKFIPRFAKKNQPFICYPNNPLPDNLDSPYFRPLKPGETVPAPTGG